ncbi:SPOR domain-containing protein [Novosphingobium pokkalii]|uniref:SPOR domain-containing protein n=1 Tax=Novosphingobium pokkalii TaxID=1770194 RepID=UPI003632C3E7
MATLVPGSALADVRDGVNAWSRGDYAAAVRQWQGPAAKGDADAQFNMGQAAKLGRGMPKDMAKAEDWFHKAARQGHARAADNYGILLFQTGRQSEALPWLNASADRGEPRAMYVLGVAAFNGDFQPKDWVRAYALMTRAAAVGLPQAIESLKTMNQVIPLEQRQMGASVAADLEARTSDQRSRELAAAELGVTAPTPDAPAAPAVAAISRPAQASLTPVDLPPARTGAPDGRVLAGASYANPVEVPRAASSAPKPRPVASAPAKAPFPAPAEKALRPAAGGAWRIQLGAFAQKSNADGLWARVRGRAELAGHPRIDLAQGSVTRLLAGGFASQAEAARACAALKGAGVDCIPVKP